uniref:Secreted protein n=1 Tax=Angiostrongylus cantonensis TaxID=6313 RepID=A0A0K0CWS9_ANGCA
MFSRPLVIQLMLLIAITHACHPKNYCCQSFRRRRIVAEYPTLMDDRHLVVNDPQRTHSQSYQINEAFSSQSMDAINLKREA